MMRAAIANMGAGIDAISIAERPMPRLKRRDEAVTALGPIRASARLRLDLARGQEVPALFPRDSGEGSARQLSAIFEPPSTFPVT